jgi:hypothetical protein
MLSCRPVPALRSLIRYYYQVETRLAGRIAVQPVPARSPQAIEFTFGAPYEVRRLDRGGTRDAYPIALIGSQTFRRVELLMHGNIDAFTIVFQPGGVSTLFSVPVVTHCMREENVDARVTRTSDNWTAIGAIHTCKSVLFALRSIVRQIFALHAMRIADTIG